MCQVGWQEKKTDLWLCVVYNIKQADFSYTMSDSITNWEPQFDRKLICKGENKPDALQQQQQQQQSTNAFVVFEKLLQKINS